MGTLREFRQIYEKRTSTASDVARKLSFAGIAVIWIFREGSGPDARIPSEMLWPLFLLAISLALDLLHYLSASLMWGFHNWLKEGKGTAEDAEMKAPQWVNWPAILFMYAKMIALGVGYVWLMYVMWGRLPK